MSIQRKTFWILILLCAAYWAAFAFPNSSAAENIQMVMASEPDEAVPLPYVFDMIKPAASLKEALLNFGFYDYYFYGFPYFAYSAVLLIPVRLLNSLENTPLVMTVLRQMVSVLPMLAAILILVFLQTGFRSYKAFLIFALLASIPALVQNNYWWHPDSLAILFAVLTLFFLHKDDLRLGRFFYLAAFMCGISAAIKGIGFYFFLSVLVVLILAWRIKKPPLEKVALAGAGFLIAMSAAYLLSNPILIYASVRERYFFVMREQSVLLSQGYEIYYDRGVLAALPLFIRSYGQPAFSLLALAACIWAVVRGPQRLLHILILSGSIPLTFLSLVFIHFKSQYWLPVAVILFSSLASIFPEDWKIPRSNRRSVLVYWGRMLLAAAIAAQWVQFTQTNWAGYVHNLTRQENNPSIRFYNLSLAALAPLPRDRGYSVYHDVNMYVPGYENWNKESLFEMLDYPYIEGKGFDILFLMQQHIYDYLNPDVEAIDPQKLEQSRIFYRDAGAEQLRGYHLVLRNDFGLLYVKDALYTIYFQSNTPKP